MKKIYHKNGSVLVLTISLMLIFTVLGLASMEFVGTQNVQTARLMESSTAFWVADAAIERALARLPVVFTTAQNDSLGDGTYTMQSGHDTITDEQGNVLYTYNNRWALDSSATVDGQTRAIHAIASRYLIDNVITTRGPIKSLDKCPMASLNIDCDRVEENVDFTFETVFPGITWDEALASAEYEYTDPDNNEIRSLEDVTIITVLEDPKIQIPNAFFAGTGFVIVDCTAVSECEVSVEGADFQGILWVKGEAKFAGNPDITGSIFIEGDPGTETAITGTGSFTYDEQVIDQAVSHLGPAALLGKPKIIAWHEK